MGLIIIDREDSRIEAVTFDDLDYENDMCICIDFKETEASESIHIYLKRSQVEALKRHLDTELNRWKKK